MPHGGGGASDSPRESRTPGLEGRRAGPPISHSGLQRGEDRWPHPLLSLLALNPAVAHPPGRLLSISETQAAGRGPLFVPSPRRGAVCLRDSAHHLLGSLTPLSSPPPAPDPRPGQICRPPCSRQNLLERAVKQAPQPAASCWALGSPLNAATGILRSHGPGSGSRPGRALRPVAHTWTHVLTHTHMCTHAHACTRAPYTVTHAGFSTCSSSPSKPSGCHPKAVSGPLTTPAVACA